MNKRKYAKRETRFLFLWCCFFVLGVQRIVFFFCLWQEKEAEKMGKKVKIEVKIQEMREQAEYRDKVLAELRLQRASLQERLSALALTRDLLTRSDFPSRLAALAVGSPQFAATAAQYRDGLAKMLKLTEQVIDL